jgi:hypothetical protein
LRILLSPSPGRHQGGLVDQVLEVRSGEAGGEVGQLQGVHVLGHGLAPQVHQEDLLALLQRGQTHHHLAVKAARAQKGGVQDVGAVGGRQDDDRGVLLKAVHLREDLVQGLLPLVVAAPDPRPPLSADGVQLVYEDDAGGVFAGVLKEAPHPAGPHAHEHLHELAGGDGEEGDPGLPGHGPGQQGLARARGAHQEDPLWGSPPPSSRYFLGFLRKSTTSMSSLLASSWPATSLKVVLTRFSLP